MVSRIGGAAVVCPFVLIVGPASLFYVLRHTATKIAGHVPLLAGTYRQLRMYAWNFPSARRISVFEQDCGGHGPSAIFYTSLFRTRHGNNPRTSVASATRPTARIIAPARGGT